MVWMARKNGGERLPENRLYLGLPAAVISSVGLIVWGFSIEERWHWMTGQVGFFLCRSSEVRHFEFADIDEQTH